MPLYTYSCPECGHRWDKVAGFDEKNAHCPNCPWLGYRESVYQTVSVRKYGSEFVMPSSVRAAIDEAVGYKNEAAATMQEAVANGWKARE